MIAAYMKEQKWQWGGIEVTERDLNNALNDVLQFIPFMRKGSNQMYGGFNFECINTGEIIASFKKGPEKEGNLIEFTFKI